MLWCWLLRPTTSISPNVSLLDDTPAPINQPIHTPSPPPPPLSTHVPSLHHPLSPSRSHLLCVKMQREERSSLMAPSRHCFQSQFIILSISPYAAHPSLSPSLFICLFTERKASYEREMDLMSARCRMQHSVISVSRSLHFYAFNPLSSLPPTLPPLTPSALTLPTLPPLTPPTLPPLISSLPLLPPTLPPSHLLSLPLLSPPLLSPLLHNVDLASEGCDEEMILFSDEI